MKIPLGFIQSKRMKKYFGQLLITQYGIQLLGQLKDASLVELGEICLEIIKNNIIKKPSEALLEDVYNNIPKNPTAEQTQDINSATQQLFTHVSNPISSFNIGSQILFAIDLYHQALNSKNIYPITHANKASLLVLTEEILQKHVFDKIFWRADHPNPMNQIAETHSLIIMHFLGQVCDLISPPLNYGQKIKAVTFDANPYDMNAFLDIYNKIGKLLIESDEQYCELEKPDTHSLETTLTRGFFEHSQNNTDREAKKKENSVTPSDGSYGTTYSSITRDQITPDIKAEVAKLRSPTHR